MRTMIPADTKLPAYRIPMLKTAINRRLGLLKKCDISCAEMSLFLMCEIEHLKELLRFNGGSL